MAVVVFISPTLPAGKAASGHRLELTRAMGSFPFATFEEIDSTGQSLCPAAHDASRTLVEPPP